MTRAAFAAATTLALVPAAAHAADLKVATTDPKAITATGATLHADVDHATAGGNVAWQYGTSLSYGATTLALALTAQDARSSPRCRSAAWRRARPITCGRSCRPAWPRSTAPTRSS